MPPRKLQLILTNAHIKGFKSIEDLEADFVKGINILIGKNASGKSNFLECIYQVLSTRRDSKEPFKYAKLDFITSDNHVFTIISDRDVPSHIEKDIFEDRIRFRERLFIDKKLVFDNFLDDNQKKVIEFNNKKFVARGGSVISILRRIGFTSIIPLYIKFNLPSNLEGISIPGIININIEDDKMDIWDDLNTLTFLRDMLWGVEFSFEMDLDKLRKITKSSLLKKLKIKEEIVENLKRFTSIQDLRFNENINIYKEEKLITIENLKIDFKLNNSWIPWSQLSDGTKRLFYLISEITNLEKGFVLVEEPELGVHPHQFNLIMEFLKAESERKQIILSTHSPQALNHLDESELTHILITRYENRKGTQIKHLTKTQISKAKKYMKEVGFFSDYWMISDLE
jgi:predicted ATP-dependent endonuclease of OLD family